MTDTEELKQLGEQMQSIMDEIYQLTEGEENEIDYRNPYGKSKPFSQERMERAEDDSLGVLMEKIRSGEPLTDQEQQALEVALEAARSGEANKAGYTEILEPVLEKLQAGEGLTETEENTLIEALETILYDKPEAGEVEKALMRHPQVKKSLESYTRAIRYADEVIKNNGPERPTPILRTPEDDKLMKSLIDEIRAANGQTQHPGSPNPAHGNHPLADMERGEKASVLKSLFPEWYDKRNHADQARKTAGSFDGVVEKDRSAQAAVRKATGEATPYDLQRDRKAGIKSGLKALFSS